MCTSVPQIAVFLILISTSLGPISGTGTSSIQMPGSALAFTSAFIMFDILLSLESLDAESLFGGSGNDAQFLADRAERFHRTIDIGAGVRRRHLRADAGLTLWHHRERKSDDIDATLQHARRHLL